MLTPAQEIAALNERLHDVYKTEGKVTLDIDRLPFFGVLRLNPLEMDPSGTSRMRRLNKGAVAVRSLILLDNSFHEALDPCAIVEDGGQLLGVPITPDQVNAVGAILRNDLSYDFYASTRQPYGLPAIYRIAELEGVAVASID